MPPARRAVRRVAGLLGATPYNWTTLKMVRRREWLYRGRRVIPRGRLEFRSPFPPTDDDVVLSGRLIEAYVRATGGGDDAPQTTGIWEWIRNERQGRLADALERRDADRLAALLASMFREEFVVGMAYGDLIRDAMSPLGARIWWLRSLDSLVSLAEALAVVPVETPEQGRVGVAFEHGVTGVVAAIERALGTTIDFPAVGAAYGIRAGATLVAPDSPEQIYAAVRLRDAARRHAGADGDLRVVEIGAGYGAMAYWFLRLCPTVGRYWIVDLPIVNVLQGYFLSQALGPERVSLLGETPRQVAILPDSRLDAIEVPYDVLANKDSMPEMPETAMIGYLEWARATCGGILFSYNQEAGAAFQGEPQNVVPHAVARVGGFARVRRDLSWVRPGYVEEIYERAERPAP
jgi:hypothetical protein